MTSLMPLTRAADAPASGRWPGAQPASSRADVRPGRPETGGVVHLVESDEGLRLSLAALFASVGIETRTYSALEGLGPPARVVGPACLLVDARLTLIRGLGLEAQLKPLGGHVPVVVIASDADVPLAVEAMKAGAIDFLAKPLRDRDVLAAVGAALSEDRERREADARKTELRARFATLTRREREVMALVTAGRLNKQVAGDLGLSEITVKVHRGAAMRKMGARTLVDLVRMADSLSLGTGGEAARDRPLRSAS